ncbi:Persistence and stress-resistance antitoxin PasI [Andreprevotia sp. IGB-42]|uniref:RnfH family protein n=1 Tax=Andreprevotia sp. IGB-42 TaxID=2497473 RepID=UPI001358FDF9|nr:RnfH family protein [Andreprevotia sp. IGB-42]KAF0813253.1 Persistence and stress-resistance antitoxin PasI [Andreprevotia sp. IGB-42]
MADALTAGIPPGVIQIEVVYATPARQQLVALVLPVPATAGAAIDASGLLAQYPDIDLQRNRIGIFGKVAQPGTPLRDGDRVEIYRPLIADPKEVRRARVAEGKTMGAGREAAAVDAAGKDADNKKPA